MNFPCAKSLRKRWCQGWEMMPQGTAAWDGGLSPSHTGVPQPLLSVQLPCASSLKPTSSMKSAMPSPPGLCFSPKPRPLTFPGLLPLPLFLEGNVLSLPFQASGLSSKHLVKGLLDRPMGLSCVLALLFILEPTGLIVQERDFCGTCRGISKS